MYIDTYAKDYVDTMMISPAKTEEKKDVEKDETKENEPAKEPVDQADGAEKNQVFNNLILNHVLLFMFILFC